MIIIFININILGYFSTIESDFQSNIQGSFITTNYGYIIIKNSIFENISIDGPAPLIYGSETTIEYVELLYFYYNSEKIY